MLPIDFIFYIFSLVTISAASFVIFSNNSVHSVLWLILAFISAAGLFILLNAEFIAMLVVVVYVGAVAVLFLFVVMMLNSDPPSKQVKFKMYKWWQSFYSMPYIKRKLTSFTKNYSMSFRTKPTTRWHCLAKNFV